MYACLPACMPISKKWRDVQQNFDESFMDICQHMNRHSTLSPLSLSALALFAAYLPHLSQQQMLERKLERKKETRFMLHKFSTRISVSQIIKQKGIKTR
jgi:hypothetical protein